MINAIVKFSFSVLGLLVFSLSVSQAADYGPVFPSGTFETEVPVSFTPCANDFGKCSINLDQVGPHNVVSVFYGAQGKYILFSGRGDFTCSPTAFNIADPVPNVKKSCWIFAGFARDADATAGSPNTDSISAVPAGMTPCDGEQGGH